MSIECRVSSIEVICRGQLLVSASAFLVTSHSELATSS